MMQQQAQDGDSGWASSSKPEISVAELLERLASRSREIAESADDADAIRGIVLRKPLEPQLRAYNAHHGTTTP